MNATPEVSSLRSKRFSVAELNELWRLRGLGRSPQSIGRVLGRSSRSVYAVIVRAGGIKPTPRKRSEHHLSAEEREEISRSLARRESIRSIARALGRPPSTICREVARNGGRFRYRAAHADRRAWSRARRPKLGKLEEGRNRTLRAHVVEKLVLDWSPQQIAGWTRVEFEDPAMHISHESIYRALFVQTRGSLRKELARHLRRRKSIRRPAASSKKRPTGGAIQDGVSIRERPPEVEDRAVPGHWEGDFLCGKKGTQVATLVERKTRFVMLVKVDAPDAVTTANALIAAIRNLPEALKDSLTWDRGSEMAGHERIAFESKMDIYFCDPRSPWQRGSNENTNGLLRQYLLKGTDLSQFTQEALNAIADRLNGRPRQTLGWKTPAQALDEVLR